MINSNMRLFSLLSATSHHTHMHPNTSVQLHRTFSRFYSCINTHLFSHKRIHLCARTTIQMQTNTCTHKAHSFSPVAFVRACSAVCSLHMRGYGLIDEGTMIIKHFSTPTTQRIRRHIHIYININTCIHEETINSYWQMLANADTYTYVTLSNAGIRSSSCGDGIFWHASHRFGNDS